MGEQEGAAGARQHASALHSPTRGSTADQRTVRGVRILQGLQPALDAQRDLSPPQGPRRQGRALTRARDAWIPNSRVAPATPRRRRADLGILSVDYERDHPRDSPRSDSRGRVPPPLPLHRPPPGVLRASRAWPSLGVHDVVVSAAARRRASSRAASCAAAANPAWLTPRSDLLDVHHHRRRFVRPPVLPPRLQPLHTLARRRRLLPRLHPLGVLPQVIQRRLEVDGAKKGVEDGERHAPRFEVTTRGEYIVAAPRRSGRKAFFAPERSKPATGSCSRGARRW